MRPPRSSARRTCAALATVALAAGFTPAALAHPHFRFTYQVEPVVEAAALVGLRITWWVDTEASAQIRQAADLNRNGRLDPEELAAFARGNESLLRPQGFFLRVDAEEVKDAAGADGRPPALGGQLSGALGVQLSGALSAGDDGAAGIRLQFTMRFFEPPPAAFSVRFFDPTWNVALTPHAALMPVPASAPHGCLAEPVAQTLSTMGWGDQTVTRVVIRCARAEPARLQAHASHQPRARMQETEQ